jgi:uncharacterized protein YgbK (DUF1537 family)
MSDRYLIIADDFTGANDTGVQLRRRGYSTAVLFAGRPLPDGADCAVIDTESRGLSPRDAAAAMDRACAEVDFARYKYVLKKVDSTLRGNIAAELQAMDRAFAPELVIFAPALPDLGRTTEGGVHRLKGVPITRTELARDPKKPVREDNLAALLREVYTEPVTHVGLDAVRSGGYLGLERGRVFSFDAVTNEDMRRIIGAARSTGRRVLWVGTAAMADNLMELERRTPPVLGVVSSVSDVAGTQVRAAADAGISLVAVPFHRLISGEEVPGKYAAAALELLRAGRDTILVSSVTLDRSELDRSLAAGRARDLSAAQVSEFVQDAVGAMAAEVLASVPVSGVFASGGDTAMGLLSRLGADGSEILSEISVGIPLVRLVGGGMPGLRMVTKAGAFGAPDAVTFAFRKLKEV